MVSGMTVAEPGAMPQLLSLTDELARMLNAARERTASWPDMAERFADMRTRFETFMQTIRVEQATLRSKTAEVVAALRSHEHHDDVRPPASFDDRFEQLRLAYEGLVDALQTAPPTIARPQNITRSLVHAISAVLGLVVLAVAPTPWLFPVAATLALCAWTMETARRHSPRVNALLMKAFSPIAHVHEHRHVNSATWYVTALTILTLTQTPWLCAVGVAVLGFADPAAGAMGRKWGRVRLVNNRTLEGTLAFTLVAYVSSVTVAMLFGGHSFAASCILAVGASVVGAAAELWSRRLDDNLTVPLGAAAGAWVMLPLATWLTT